MTVSQLLNVGWSGQPPSAIQLSVVGQVEVRDDSIRPTWLMLWLVLKAFLTANEVSELAWVLRLPLARGNGEVAGLEGGGVGGGLDADARAGGGGGVADDCLGPAVVDHPVERGGEGGR